jgi:hypothetical protein
MSKSKNQHWVPQFYLREFATPDTRETKQPKVWIFSRDAKDGDEKLTWIRNVCAQRYLYSPKAADGERSWQVDDDLEGVEMLLAQFWSEISTDFIDLANESIRKALSLFIATNYVRHPANIRTVKEIHRQLLQLYEALPKNSEGTPDISSFSFNGKEYPLDTSDWHSYRKLDENDHHHFFVKRIRADAGHLAEIILQKRWSVVFTDKPHFITSDKPVILQNFEKERFGFGTAGSIISFPLSPTRLLIMDDRYEEPPNQYYQLIPDNLGGYNLSIWRESTRFMITGRAIPDVLNEIVSWSERD